MTTAAALRVACPDCRHENEPERIYCHECGARLDRSSVQVRKITQRDPPEAVHKRLRSMFSQRRARVRSLLANLAKIVIAALGAAVMAEMLIAPDLPSTKNTGILPAQIGLDLEMLVQSRKPALLRYSEPEVNASLANVLKSKKQRLSHSVLNFERVVVGLGDGTFRVIVGRSLFGFPIYTTGLYNVELAGGKLNVTATGGAVGRVPIHPRLMQGAGMLFSDVVSALDRERKLISRAGSMQVRNQELLFTPPQ